MWSSGSPLAVGRKQTRGTGRRASPRMNSSRTVLSGSIVKPPPLIAKMVRITSRDGEEVALVAEAPRRKRRLAGAAVDGLDPIGSGARAGADDARQLAADEVQRGAVVGGVAGRHAVDHAGQVRPAASGLAVVVHAVRPRQQPEAGDPLRPAVERRDRLLEPAQRSRAQPAQDGPLLPAGAQHLVEAVRAPDAEQRDDAAAADVDQ